VPQLSHGHQKEHIKSEDPRPHGGEQWKKKENNTDGHHGAKPKCKHKTEAIGIIVSRPYAPAGTKKEGEGESPSLSEQAREQHGRLNQTLISDRRRLHGAASET